VVTPFTDSLDPIKAYECLATRRPTVSTPVAGFRELADRVTVASRQDFVSQVIQTLACPGSQSRSEMHLPSWDDRAAQFEDALLRAHGKVRP
jgi:hypothetical protein